MRPDAKTDFANEHALEHLEDEIKKLEGVTRWGRPLTIAGLVLAFVAIVGGLVWFILSPPQAVSRHSTPYGGPMTGTPIEVAEPRGTLTGPPQRFTWEPVTGRLQYVLRVFEKGSATPIFERITTATSIELAPDDQARMPRGKTYVWRVAAQGMNGAKIREGGETFKVR